VEAMGVCRLLTLATFVVVTVSVLLKVECSLVLEGSFFPTNQVWNTYQSKKGFSKESHGCAIGGNICDQSSVGGN